MHRRCAMWLVVMVAVAPATVMAAEPRSPQALEGDDESRGHLETRNGVALSLGVGAMNYTSGTARELMTSDLGAYAELRAVYGTRTRLAVEAAFTRTQHRVSSDRPHDYPQFLFGHAFEGLVRVNHNLHEGRLFFSAFAVAGLGWTDFTPPDDRDPTSPNETYDRAGIAPLGVGLATSFGTLYGEARLMYRPAFAIDKLGFRNISTPRMDAWFAGVAIGVEL